MINVNAFKLYFIHDRDRLQLIKVKYKSGIKVKKPFH